MSVNKVILIGNVGADPEMRYPEKDMAVACLSLATSDRQQNSSVELTEWHRLVIVGEPARFAERYIRKGTRLYVEGKLRYRTYEDKFKIRHKTAEILVQTFEILGRPDSRTQ